MSRLPTFLLAGLSLAVAATGIARETAPDWLRAAAAARAVAPIKEDTAAVVLLDEGVVKVGRDGAFATRLRFALRVVAGDGRKHALARVPYLLGASEVKSLKAWLINPSGEVVAYAKRHTTDAAIHTSALELYGEQRMKLISAQDDARPGAIFGFEAEVTEKTILTQRVWRFQARLPVERSSFSIQLPPGWKLEAHVFNHEPVAPVVQGDCQTWTLTGLAATTPEPMGPPPDALVPWLAVDLLPPAGVAGGDDRLTFKSWEAIAAYFSPRYDTAAQVDAGIKSRAATLVANAATPWDRIRALCRYAQQVNYISIQLDAANAGGMIPRPATRVLQCNYGDCKDKTTLLRALLASQGVTAWPLIVTAGGRKEIRENWPSPLQFNHCILAISVDQSVEVPATITHPVLGRLVIFDPTNEFTPAGLLADERLANRGLLLAGSHSALVTLPEMNPEDNRLDRRLTARLDALGNIAGTVHEEFFGQASAGARAERYRDGKADFQKRIERWLAATLPALRTTRVETGDTFAEAHFTHDADFAAFGYGKMMRDQLLVFKPVLVARRNSTPLRKGPRTQPVVLSSSRYTERAEIELPAGYALDENIAPVALEASFGRYTAQASLDGGRLVFERALDLRAAEIPAADYERVRAFFEKIIQSEQSPVVLRRL